MSSDTSTTTSRIGRDARENQEIRESAIHDLRKRLYRNYNYLDDEDSELYREVSEWLRASTTLSSGSVRSAVKSRLRELKRGNKMRWHRDADEPGDAFPDECADCEHYGVACPVVKRWSVKKEIERIFDTAEDDQEVVEKLTDIAIDVGCHVVLEELERWEQDHKTFLERGYELDAKLTAHLKGIDYDPNSFDIDEYAEDLREFRTDPPPEQAERVEAVIDAVMSDDEDDDDGRRGGGRW